MIIEFRPNNNFSYINAFAAKFTIPSTENLLVIPHEHGEGRVRKIQLSEEFMVLLHHYKLKEDLFLKRLAPEKKTDRVTMLFYRSKFPDNTFFSTKDNAQIKGPILNNSTIQISSSDLISNIKFPANTDIDFTVVAISARLLQEYFHSVQDNIIIKNIINSENSSFLYYEKMGPAVEIALENIGLINLHEPLSEFYFRLKVEELIYHVFEKLLKREPIPHKRLNNKDVIKIHAIKNEILKDFNKSPVLEELASNYGFSQTKLKILFKQIYGDTIYNYFQAARMDQAAFLLKKSDYTVSEIGYLLGFINLSHFSRLFKKHYSMTPKKYASVG